MSLLEVEDVSKIYKHGVLANDQISLTVEAGEVFGLLGPNGAGKTTLVNQIIGLISPTSGQIFINEVNTTKNSKYARQACSFQPQSQIPINGVSPRQAIEIVGRIRGGTRLDVHRRTSELLHALEINNWANTSGQHLSGGVRRLTAFCMAAVVPGRLMILDEPTNDVDPLRRRLLWQQVRELADAGTAVVLVTHNVMEAERAVDQLVIIDQGKVVAMGTPGSLKDANSEWLRLELVLEPETNPPLLPKTAAHPVLSGRRLSARVKTEDLGKVISWIQDNMKSTPIEEFSIGPSSLEDVYLRIIGREDVQISDSQEDNYELAMALA